MDGAYSMHGKMKNIYKISNGKLVENKAFRRPGHMEWRR